MDAEQLRTDLAAAEEAVVDIKTTAEAMRQELQDQHKQRDASTVQSPQHCSEVPCIDSFTPRRSWKKQRRYMRRNLLI